MATNLTSDIIYLVNYDSAASAMCIYNNAALSHSQSPPDQVAPVTSGSYVTWEANGVNGALWLPFRTAIDADAISQPAGTPVGKAQQLRPSVVRPGSDPGTRGFAVYNVVRGDGRVLYTDPVLGNAYSLYVCTDAREIVATD